MPTTTSQGTSQSLNALQATRGLGWKLSVNAVFAQPAILQNSLCLAKKSQYHAGTTSKLFGTETQNQQPLARERQILVLCAGQAPTECKILQLLIFSLMRRLRFTRRGSFLKLRRSATIYKLELTLLTLRRESCRWATQTTRITTCRNDY